MKKRFKNSWSWQTGCPTEAAETRQISLWWCARKAATSTGCPIDFQQAAEFPVLPEGGTDQGKELEGHLPLAPGSSALGAEKNPQTGFARLFRVGACPGPLAAAVLAALDPQSAVAAASAQGAASGLTRPTCFNQVWTVDFKGWFRIAAGQRQEPLTVRDLFNRLGLCVRLLPS